MRDARRDDEEDDYLVEKRNGRRTKIIRPRNQITWSQWTWEIAHIPDRAYQDIGRPPSQWTQARERT